MASQFADRRRVSVLHDGMDLREFEDVDRASARHAFRGRHGLDGFVVGIVGRIKMVRKGQEVVVKAMAHLARAGRPVTCVVVGAPAPGSEHHLPELQRLARELGVEERVRWIGEVPDARIVYPALDVLILASVQPEPFSGVVMEAMAMGAPVVASRNGGSVDQVEEGVTGLLSRPGDGEDLAEKLAYLMDRPELRQQMSEAGPRRLAAHFSMDGMMRKIEGIYGEALGA
jgi:glycosyltransferase involved in cell wall biosynthesis